MCFLCIQTKTFSINVSKLFFKKYLHFKSLTVKVCITKDTKGTSSLFIRSTKYIGDIF